MLTSDSPTECRALSDLDNDLRGAGFTRQHEDDGYLPRELDYDTGLTMTAAKRPK
jgi:hypothetical protein